MGDPMAPAGDTDTGTETTILSFSSQTAYASSRALAAFTTLLTLTAMYCCAQYTKTGFGVT